MPLISVPRIVETSGFGLIHVSRTHDNIRSGHPKQALETCSIEVLCLICVGVICIYVCIYTYTYIYIYIHIYIYSGALHNLVLLGGLHSTWPSDKSITGD